MRCDDVPDIHDTDARDFEEFLRGGFRPDPEIVKWIEDLKLALKKVGFSKTGAEYFIEGTDIKFDYTIDPVDFVDDLRFCSECTWQGRSGELEEGRCPSCGNHKL